MLIYDRATLRNLQLQEEADRWHDSGLISSERFEAIKTDYPVDSYTPNIFIRVTLFLATVIIVMAIWGLVGLSFGVENELAFKSSFLLFGAALYIFLERQIVRQKRFFQAGVDDALLWLAPGFFLTGLFLILQPLLKHIPPPVFLLLPLPVLIWLAARFASSLMAAVTFAYVFAQFLEFGSAARAVLPFVMMLLSATTFLLANRYEKIDNLWPWQGNAITVKTLSIILFYLASNYLVVRELSVAFLDMELQPGEAIPFATFFYVATAIVPVAYLVCGLRERDLIFIRVSLAALAGSVFTWQYYVDFGPSELVLLVAGAACMLLAGAAIRFLRRPVNGYTHQHLLNRSAASLDAEALLIAETMPVLSDERATDDEPKFGGGKSGGGGASGEY